ncbi:MAG TPA: MFS transporter [Bryobacteraceae bacterium]|nr:MFS transporter [Bryobacteraceae bacterium]
MTPETAVALGKPTAVRWRLFGLLLAVVTLTFIDRFNMNVAAKYIQQEFSLSNVQIGSLLSAFVLGYASFQAPGGWLGDRLGARRVLLAAILWWSVFTAFCAALPIRVAGLGVMSSFWLVRFLIGVGEGPALPNVNKMIGCWMAPRERARGSSVFLMAVGVGGAFTPPVIAWIMVRWGWRPSFALCGALGLAIATIWQFTSTERPEQHPRVNAAELELIQAGRRPARSGPTPWRRILSGSSIYALLVGNFMLGYVTYIFYTWFFLYLVNVRHLPVIAGSYWSTTPFVAILIAAPLGGWISDRMVGRFGHPWGRRIPVLISALGSAVLLAAGARAQNPFVAIALLAVAAGCNSVAAVTSWALPNDLSEHHSGSVAGILNTTTNLGGALSPVLTPFLATRFDWITAIDFAAGLMFCICLLWLFVHPERRIDED